MESTCTVDEYGCQHWRLPNGKLHRQHGPAYTSPQGILQQWWVNGKLHRTDGPAMIWSDGAREWWVNGQRHRLDGPAVIYDDGSQEWYVDDVEITKQVNTWTANNNIAWPWDAATQLEFTLRFT